MTQSHLEPLNCVEFFGGVQPCRINDQDGALRLLSETLVSRFSDWCLIELCNPTGPLIPVLVRHRDPHKMEDFCALAPSLRLTEMTGKTEILARDAVLTLRDRGFERERLELLQRLGTHWYFSLPLSANNRVFGTVSGGGHHATVFPGIEEIKKFQAYFECISSTLHQCSLSEELESLLSRRIEHEKNMASAIHDLKNDLHVILLSQSLLEDKKVKIGMNPSVRKCAERMGRAARRMNALFESMLDSSDYSRENRVKEFSDIELGPVLEESLEALAPIAEVRKIELAIQGAAKSKQVRGIRPKLLRVLTNLLRNAIAFSKDHSRVGVRVEEFREQGEIKISVCDSGAGIPADARKNIFSPGWVGPSSLVGGKAQAGYGIGLQNAKTFIEQMGGKIWVESEEGQEGSCFSFTLPLAP
ncbi:HAMP domain-containing sensor histidine kinase [Bdellovibrionota bacterium FG-2]